MSNSGHVVAGKVQVPLIMLTMAQLHLSVSVSTGNTKYQGSGPGTPKLNAGDC